MTCWYALARASGVLQFGPSLFPLQPPIGGTMSPPAARICAIALASAPPCSGREPSQAHHLTFCQRRGLSLKSGDQFCVPLCGLHHDELHRSGSEREWWERHQINPEPVAAGLWARTRMPSGMGLEPASSLHVVASDVARDPTTPNGAA